MNEEEDDSSIPSKKLLKTIIEMADHSDDDSKSDNTGMMCGSKKGFNTVYDFFEKNLIGKCDIKKGGDLNLSLNFKTPYQKEKKVGKNVDDKMLKEIRFTY